MVPGEAGWKNLAKALPVIVNFIIHPFIKAVLFMHWPALTDH